MISTNTPRIDTPAILDELSAGTEVRDADGDTGIKTNDGAWQVIGYGWALDADWFTFPVAVINPTPETAELVGDLAGPTTLPTVMTELRSIIAEVRKLYDEQEAELGELRDEDGDVPSGNLRRWDELRYDVHGEQDSNMLGEALARLEKLVGAKGGE